MKILLKNSTTGHAARLNGIAKVESKKGFALIVTLTLMVLLLIIAVGLLSISTVSLRSSGVSRDREIARGNAKLAMIMAISRLQELAGSDTRVTAPADALPENDEPSQLTGVWRSWEGTDHQSNGQPITPNYGSKSQQYTSSGSSGRFLAWLISGDGAEASPTSPPDLKEGANTVPLVAEGSLGIGTDNEVHLVPTEIDDTGAFAWWIQGENSKAFIKEPDPEPSDIDEWSQRLASHGLPDPTAFGFDDPDELNRLISSETFDLVSNSSSGDVASVKYFGDITSYSRGLLTNTANGGWRRDLSLMAEKWDRGAASGSLPTNGLPVFSAEPFEEEIERSLRLADDPGSAAIYPWVTADYTAMSWQALLDYVSLYKEVKTNASSSEPYFDAVATSSSDRISIQSIVARVHIAFGYDATKATNGAGDDVYTPRFLFKPSVTLWNPYNVAIENSRTKLFHLYNDSFPIKLYAKIGDQTETQVDMQDLMETSGKSPMMRVQASILGSADSTMKPGESRMFGKEGEGEGGIQVIYLDPGFRIEGSYVRNLSNGAPGITPGAAEDEFTYRWEPNVVNGDVSAYLQYFRGRNTTSVEGKNLNTTSTKYWMKTPAATVAEKLPMPELVNDNQTLKSAFEEDSPFLAISMGLRTFMNEDSSGELSKIHTKGYINTNPISTNRDGNVVPPFVSVEDSPYTWEVFAPNSWEDPFIPQSDDAAAFGADHSSYVGSSFQSGLGLNRWVIAELPTQPLLSLGELQHFDISYSNHTPPRVANAIGNSHASPHIGSGQVIGTSNSSIDHSYASNHVLFDDWFVSSITPDVVAFTQNENRTIEEVYADHLSLETPLRNRRYLPAKPLASGDASKAAEEILSEDMAWHDIAAEIEVEGMFNINSTSVEAWKAVLMNQRDAQVPQISMGAATADDWSIDLADSSGTVVSRTTVAGDPLSAADSAIAELADFTTFTDDQVEALAEEIVEQIRERGPFLSLSEFVNRRLSSDDDLAMAGTIETALMNLASSSTDNPFADIQAAFPQQATLPSDASSIYEYPEAAVGYATYGTPGWPRQADILRPLAPIISARDDTFVIRAYGEARNANTGEVTASSWCEATVQRKAEYVDSEDAPSEYADLQSDLNEMFGRKFDIVSFRWLSPDEI
ncbi:MAG: hypothetical protein ACSHX9_12850 [Luteolibacter sp.]